jgi:hypothetical protein
MKLWLAALLFLTTHLMGKPSQEDDFESLMGKGTKHWSHVHQEVDRQLIDQAHRLYTQGRELQFLKASVGKIPRVVHFIWLGPRPFPPESVQNIRSWMAQNPDWTFKFWTDRLRDAPCNGMETVVVKQYPFPLLGRCYEASENWGEKSDILRYEILFHQGGVYADHDVSCLLPMDPLHLAYDFYGGLEPPHPSFAGFHVTLGNALIASRAGHPILKRVIELVEQRWGALAEKYPGKDGFSRTQVVMERTYLAFTEAAREKAGLSKNIDIIMPAAYFFAKKGLKPIYTSHLFANKWAQLDGKDHRFEKETEKGLARLDKKLKKLLSMEFLFLSFNLLLFVFWIVLKKRMRIA